MLKRHTLVHPLTGLGGDPIQHEQAWNHVGENAIQGITDRVRVTIDREKHLDTKDNNKHHQYDALPGNGIIQPAPLAKPGFFHDSASSFLRSKLLSFHYHMPIDESGQALKCRVQEEQVLLSVQPF